MKAHEDLSVVAFYDINDIIIVEFYDIIESYDVVESYCLILIMILIHTL